MTIRLRVPTASGLAQGSVVAEFVRNGQAVRQDLFLTWNVRALYSVQPQSVYFGKIKAGMKSPFERRVVLRKGDKTPWRIRGVKTPASVRASLEESREPSECRLLLVLNAADVRESFCEDVVVESEEGPISAIRIPVAAIVTP